MELDLGTIKVFTEPKVTLDVRNQDGQPLAYIAVNLRPRSEGQGFLYFTNAQGKLSLPLPEGTYTAQVVSMFQDESFTSREVTVTVQGDKPQPVVITARRTRAWRPQELRLQVRTARNQMPKKPWVQVVTSFMVEEQSVRVEKDAAVLQVYQMVGEPVPEVVLIDASSGEGAVLKSINPDNPPKEVRLKPLPRVYGRVLDTAGKPIAGASAHLIFGRYVQMRIGDEGSVSQLWLEYVTPALATADRLGRFALPILPDVTCWMLVKARGYTPGIVPVVRGKPVTLRLSRATHQYAGTVVTSYGEPVAGATVRARYRPPGSSDVVPADGSVPRMPTRRVNLSEVQTDAQGRFAFSAMPERIQLEVFTSGANLSPTLQTVKPSRNLLVVLTAFSWAREGKQETTPNVDFLLKQVEWLNQPAQLTARETLLVFTAPYLAQNESLFASLRDLPADRWQVVVILDSYNRKEVEQYCRRIHPIGIVGWWKPRREGDLPVLIHEVLPGLPYIVILDKSGKPQRFGVKVHDLPQTLSALR
ncbi:MAG: carboxypeptidase regulatory-like domain-containing protein [Chthonomonadetes bacterium]|nr:carboxypeptidase regulatory-like domain-containing protein [Chthonomonadetes bacterium]